MTGAGTSPAGAAAAWRVLHVNDVAGVASAAVAQALREGLPWRLWPLPAVRGSAPVVKVARRACDLAAFRPVGRSADVLHVHYGLFGYYAWSVRRPYVLHLHGTDVRGNLRSRALRPLVLTAIRHAGAVAYSTPDLAAAVRSIRPDAVWLPAPLHPDVDGATPGAVGADADLRVGAGGVAGAGLHTAADPRQAPRIVFASRFDPVKGLDRQVELARDIRARYPDADMVGIDWGSGARRIESAGVRLCPLLPPATFRALLAGANVVIGQLASGALGVADLEAMALGRPLIARFAQADAYGAAPDIWNTDEVTPMAALQAILADPRGAAARSAAARDWALQHHGAEEFVRAALTLYARALGG